MDLLYAAFSYPPNIGGGELHLHELVRRMQRCGHSVEVVSQTARPFEDVLSAAATRAQRAGRYEWEGVPIRHPGRSPMLRARMTPWTWAYRRGGRLGALASRRLGDLLAPSCRRALADTARPPDLIHAVRMGYGFLVGHALARARELDRPFVFTRMHHDADRDPQRSRYDRVAREADAVLALTEYERDVLVRKGVAPERVHVTGVGPLLSEKADVPGFRRSLGLDAPYALFLGRQMPSKGIGMLLRAARRVWRERPEVHFVFAGPQTEYGRRLFAEESDPRILDLGPLTLETKTAALAGCELLCLPSLKESFGGVLTEAWACGKPVVAADLAAIASVVEHGRTGLLVEPEPGPIADAMLELLRHPTTAQALGAAGLERVRERYAWGRLTAHTEAVYASLS